MTTPTPDPLALAEEAEKAICNRVRGKDRDYGPLTNREYQDILALASALRAAHEELDTIRAVVGATQNETTLHAVREMDEIMEHYIGKARELFEENTRLREALEEREGDMHLRIRAGYDKTVADSWRQENTRLREALGELVAAMERYENEAEGDAPQSHLDMMARVRSALAGGKGEG